MKGFLRDGKGEILTSQARGVCTPHRILSRRPTWPDLPGEYQAETQRCIDPAVGGLRMLT